MSKMRKVDAMGAIWIEANRCYDATADLKKFSTDESDEFFEAAENIMKIISKHRGEVEARESRPEE